MARIRSRHKANDGTTLSPEATANITVNPVNDAPVADTAHSLRSWIG
jgi:hypothetical protein